MLKNKTRENNSEITNDYRIDSWKMYRHQPRFIIEEPRRYSGGEPMVCAKFGCGKHLTLQEQLFGEYCAGCQGDRLVGKAKLPSLEEALLKIMTSKLK